MRSSYLKEDVILLLKDITGLVKPQPTEEREKSEKTVGENTENRRRDESQARGKEEDRRVIDLPSP